MNKHGEHHNCLRRPLTGDTVRLSDDYLIDLALTTDLGLSKKYIQLDDEGGLTCYTRYRIICI